MKNRPILSLNSFKKNKEIEIIDKPKEDLSAPQPKIKRGILGIY